MCFYKLICIHIFPCKSFNALCMDRKQLLQLALYHILLLGGHSLQMPPAKSSISREEEHFSEKLRKLPRGRSSKKNNFPNLLQKHGGRSNPHREVWGQKKSWTQKNWKENCCKHFHSWGPKFELDRVLTTSLMFLLLGNRVCKPRTEPREYYSTIIT